MRAIPLSLSVLVAVAACGAGGSAEKSPAVTPDPPISLGSDGGEAGGGGPGTDGEARGATGFIPPLGAWIDGQDLRFRARSAHATRLEVSLFAAAAGDAAKLTTVLSRGTGTDTWEGSVSLAHVSAAGVTGDILYGYRAWGPNWPYDATWTPAI